MVGFLERAREHLLESRPELHRDLKAKGQVDQFLADQVDELVDLSQSLQRQMKQQNPLPKDFAEKHRALVFVKQTADEIAFQQIVLDMSHPSGASGEPTSESEMTTT